MPTAPDVAYLLCDDAPEIIEEEPERNSLLIWGTLADGRVAHILCSYHPGYQVITGYFPGETEPYKWADSEYRVRRGAIER